MPGPDHTRRRQFALMGRLFAFFCLIGLFALIVIGTIRLTQFIFE